MASTPEPTETEPTNASLGGAGAQNNEEGDGDGDEGDGSGGTSQGSGDGDVGEEDPAHEECIEGAFLDESADSTDCVALTNCVAGEFVEFTPTDTSDRRCAACPDGQFSDKGNASSCAPFTECGALEYEINAPTPSNDRVCGTCTDDEESMELPVCAWVCQGDTWDHDGDTDTDCEAKTQCVAGEHVTSPGSTTEDRACQPCASSSFATETNQESCELHTCDVGTELFIVGTATSNHICNSCPVGEYDHDSSGLTQCEVCEAGEYCAGGAAAPDACTLAMGKMDLDEDPTTPCDVINFLGDVTTLPAAPSPADTVNWTPFDLVLMWDGDSWVNTVPDDEPLHAKLGLTAAPVTDEHVYWEALDLYCRYDGANWQTLLVGDDATESSCENNALLVFASSQKSNGAFGGVAQGDAWCQGAATAADLGGTFRAWLSDDSTTPADRFSTHANGYYIRPDGVLVSSSFAGFDGNVSAAINITEYGDLLDPSDTAHRYAWTGTDTNGSAAASNCNNWTVGSSGANGQYGRPSATNFRWTDFAGVACFQAASFICIQQY